MSATMKFSEEALKVHSSYISELETGLKDTDLSEEEIGTAIDEVKQHIRDFCSIKVKNGIITTDLVNQAIHKLGKPNVIVSAYLSERTVTDRVLSNLTASPISQQRTSFNFTAKHAGNLYSFVCWMLTSSFIFYLFQFSWMDIFVVIFFALSIFLLMTISNLSYYSTNEYLRENVRLSIHQIISPIGFLIPYPFFHIWSIKFAYPLTLILCIYLYSSKKAQRQIIIWYRQITNFEKKFPT